MEIWYYTLAVSRQTAYLNRSDMVVPSGFISGVLCPHFFVSPALLLLQWAAWVINGYDLKADFLSLPVSFFPSRWLITLQYKKYKFQNLKWRETLLLMVNGTQWISNVWVEGDIDKIFVLYFRQVWMDTVCFLPWHIYCTFARANKGRWEV